MIRIPPLSCHAFLLTVMAIVFWPMSSFAEYNNPDLCKELFTRVNLQRSSLQQKPIQDGAVNAENSVLKGFLIEGIDSTETGSVLFHGLDIDDDGKEDSVVRGCGSGLGGLCSLFVEFSRGGKMNTEDGPPFYIAHMADATYMVEEIDGKTSPYTTSSSTKISLIQYMDIHQVCEEDARH